MARVKTAAPTFEAILFQTPEQRVLRLLLSESTTSFTHRVIASRLKGVRGLGGVEGITQILEKLEALGVVDFVDNRRAVRLQDESSLAHLLKVVSSVCDLESLKELLQPISSRAVLFGSRSNGKARSDSNYDVMVVTQDAEAVQQAAESHPLGKSLELRIMTPDEALHLPEKDTKLATKISRGVVLWGPM